MKFIPHDYQKYAIDFIKNNKTAALLLDMGLGKTVTTLTAIKDLMHDDFTIRRVLIIAPLRVTQSTWPTEIEKWDHLKGLTYSVVLGTPSQRIAALQKNANIYLINRENLDWLINKSGFAFDFDMVVIDELSSFKNFKAKRFTSFMKVRHKVDRDELASQIFSLRDERDAVAKQIAANTNLQQRVDEMVVFVKEHDVINEYSEVLVRRLIEKVTIFEKNIVVDFKSGVRVTVEI
ncbi:SNF2-related protein [Jeotgalibaca arthritidis]